MMKAQFFGRAYIRGFSTLEMLIAVSVLLLGMTAALLMQFGAQAAAVDAQIQMQALARAASVLDRARVVAAQDVVGVIATSSVWSVGGQTYVQTISVAHKTQCRTQATSSVFWQNSPVRPQRVELSRVFIDIERMLSLGRDCITDVSPWEGLHARSVNTIDAGVPTALDVLNGLVYGGGTASPYFFILDTTTSADKSANELVSFENGFNAGAAINALDATALRSHEGVLRHYVFAAMEATTSQMTVIDVTSPKKPTTVAVRTLNNVSPVGSEPAGHRLYYFADRLYVLTRYTAGPELHTFDVSNPEDPVELGGGVELGVTVNGIAVQERFIEGVSRRFAYLATSQAAGELKVYDVTDPLRVGAATEVLEARQDLPGIQNGLSVYPLGNRLYVGRASTPPGADLYVYDTTNPPQGLALVGGHDIGTGVETVLVVGDFAFLSTPKSKKELQVWDIRSDPIALVAEYALPGSVAGGLEYEDGFLFVTAQSDASVHTFVGY